MRGMRVVGVDGFAKGWIAVELEDGRFCAARAFRDFAEVVEAHPQARTIGVDIPIGLPVEPPRAADVDARRLLAGQASTLFPTFPREVLHADTYAGALTVCARRGWPGISRQSYALAKKILDVERNLDDRVVEVHPELSFRELAGGAPLRVSKHSWDGFMRRRALLAGAGIRLPDELGALPLVDVLDAAAAAWSAQRHALGQALSLPERPDGGVGVIWR